MIRIAFTYKGIFPYSPIIAHLLNFPPSDSPKKFARALPESYVYS